MPRTLFARLLLVFLTFGIAMVAAQLYVMWVSHAQFHEQFDQTVNRDLARQYVAANFLLADERLTAATLHRGIGKLAAANPEIDIYLLDRVGSIVASSVPEAERQRKRVDLNPLKQFVSGKPTPIFGEDPRRADGRAVFSAAPFKVEDCPGDYLYLVLGRMADAPGASKLRAAFAVREGAGVVLFAAVLAVSLSLLMLRVLTRRLSVLERTMSRFQSGSGQDVPLKADWRGDEIDRLEQIFTELAVRIESQMQELRAVDEARREMLANLSHDLRTPITTLSAHLESLQMGAATLDAAERQEYVDVAMRQTQRMAQLVEQLLEAAKLEAGQVIARPESFPIGELLHDVVQKFSLAARHKNVALVAEVDPKGLRVTADIALLERVFDNLIGNALRHTPSGGQVTLRAVPHGSGASITVTDSGCGMTQLESERIFDRFYRGDIGRSTQSGQTGLGLAIVRGILKLHGTDVSVKSAPGQGSAFSFELP